MTVSRILSITEELKEERLITGLQFAREGQRLSLTTALDSTFDDTLMAR